MESLSTIAIVCSIWLFAVIVPGPNLLITSYTAVSASRAAALVTVLGIGTGTLFWATVGFLGLHVVMEEFGVLSQTLEMLGGAYLLYLGIRLLANLRSTSAIPGKPPGAEKFGLAQCYVRGALTNLADPKPAAFLASLFAAASVDSLALGLTSIGLMVAISLLWYSIAAVSLSTRVAKNIQNRFDAASKLVGGSMFLSAGVYLVMPG